MTSSAPVDRRPPASGSTRLAAVVGSPVRHSLSPTLLNAAFAATGLDWTFTAFEVAEGDLARALDGMRALGLAGLSVGFLLADWTVAAGSLIGFTIMAVLIDAAVQLSQITGQKLIFSIDPEARGRINAAYMTVMFVVGALGSVIGSATYEAGGWSASALAGAAIGGIATLGFLLFDRGASAPR